PCFTSRERPATACSSRRWKKAWPRVTTGLSNCWRRCRMDEYRRSRNRSKTMATRPKTIDEYLTAVTAEQRAALEKLRKIIKSAVPRAEECISYGLAAFRLDGSPLVAFGAGANHCAFYPMSSTTVETHKRDLKDFETSKGTIRFSA